MLEIDLDYLMSGEWVGTDEFMALVAAIVLIAVSLCIAWAGRLGLGSEIALSSVRCFVQLLALGIIFILIIELKHGLISVIILAFMVGFATYTASQRAKGLPEAGKVTGTSITIGAIAVIPFLTVMGVTPLERPEVIIPIGAMAIGNSMNRVALALDRFRTEVRANSARIEAALALGAKGEDAIAEYATVSVRTALIPTLDNLKTMGIVWIPGAMAGLLIAGADPVSAAIIQITIIVMILTVGVVTGVVSTHMMSRLMFTKAQQLVHVPEGPKKDRKPRPMGECIQKSKADRPGTHK